MKPTTTEEYRVVLAALLHARNAIKQSIRELQSKQTEIQWQVKRISNQITKAKGKS